MNKTTIRLVRPAGPLTCLWVLTGNRRAPLTALWVETDASRTCAAAASGAHQPAASACFPEDRLCA